MPSGKRGNDDVGAVSDGRHNRLRVSAASPAGARYRSGSGMRARDALLPARLFLRAIHVCSSNVVVSHKLMSIFRDHMDTIGCIGLMLCGSWVRVIGIAP